VTNNLDTLLTTLHMEIDDHAAPPRPLTTAISHLGKVSPPWYDSLQLLDATPVPCAGSRHAVPRSDLAATGGGGFSAHSRYYGG